MVSEFFRFLIGLLTALGSLWPRRSPRHLWLASVRLTGADFSITTKGAITMFEMNDNQHVDFELAFNGRIQPGSVHVAVDPTGIVTLEPDPTDPTNEKKGRVVSATGIFGQDIQFRAEADGDPGEGVRIIPVIERLSVVERGATSGGVVFGPAVDN